MFSWRDKKTINTFQLKKSLLSGAMYLIYLNYENIRYQFLPAETKKKMHKQRKDELCTKEGFEINNS